MTSDVATHGLGERAPRGGRARAGAARKERGGIHRPKKSRSFFSSQSTVTSVSRLFRRNLKASTSINLRWYPDTAGHACIAVGPSWLPPTFERLEHRRLGWELRRTSQSLSAGWVATQQNTTGACPAEASHTAPFQPSVASAATTRLAAIGCVPEPSR